MARRTEIVNYLIHQLKGISDDPATNRANGVAQLTSGAVSGVTIDSGGRFYSEAPTVTFESPGKVTANVIPTVANGTVSFAVDVGGGSYTENPDITLEVTQDQQGFTTEHPKFGSRSWEINTVSNFPFTLPAKDHGTVGFWVWPSDEITQVHTPFMRVGGDDHNGVVVFIQLYQGAYRIGIHLEDLAFPNNSSVGGLTANAWNYVGYSVRNDGSNTQGVFINKSGAGAGKSNLTGYKFTDSNVQLLTGSSNGLIYVDDIHFMDRLTMIFPDPTTANPDPGSTFLYEDFESPSTVNAIVTTNGAIASNTVVAVSNVDTGTSISAATVTSVEAPANDSAGAVGFASLNSGGVVESVTITEGAAYTFVPRVTFGNSTVEFNSEDVQVDRRYRYLDDINDFPTVTLGGTPVEDYELLGNGQQLKTLRQSIRGYVYANQDDSLRESENLASDVEAVVSRFAKDAANLQVFKAEVTSIGTDEGLMAPYGVSEVEVRILYDDN